MYNAELFSFFSFFFFRFYLGELAVLHVSYNKKLRIAYVYVVKFKMELFYS